jgi:tetratricopeptide (TPR) repeat protein
MDDNKQIKNKASELRKSGDIKNALPIYKELWESTGDKFDGSGYAFCLRKLKKYDEALPLTKELYQKFPDFDWARIEYLWSLIMGELYQFDDKVSLDKYVETGNKILQLKPDEIALKMTAFKIAKIAKKAGNWSLVLEWLSKVTHEILTDHQDEESGWTDLELYYYYKATALLNTSQEQDAIDLINANEQSTKRQKKFFDRLKGKALIQIEKFEEGEIIYQALCKSSKIDWWLVHEHATILTALNQADTALTKYMLAASMPPQKHEMKVSLYNDIAIACEKLGKKKDALLHYRLVKSIREKNGWSINQMLSEKIEALEKEIQETIPDDSLLKACHSVWNSRLGIPAPQQFQRTKNLKGKIIIKDSSKPFCFIQTKDQKAFFCFKSDLPNGASHGEFVLFDIIESFDKKKKEKSFRAVNVKNNASS